MKIYVTKYALTKGIIECPLATQHDETLVSVWWTGGLNGQAIFRKPDWWLTLDAAKDRAEAMRTRRINNLRRQIKDLENRKF